jgi:hypothetical protein
LKSWRRQKPVQALAAPAPQISDETLKKIEREIRAMD